MSRFLVRVFPVILVIGMAAVVMAAEPDNEAPQRSGLAGEAGEGNAPVGRAAEPQLEINQAELLEQGKALVAPPALEPTRSALMLAVDQVLVETRQQVSALQDQADKEPNADSALALMRQIEELKQGAELRILRLQADHARAKGDETVAVAIEESINFMTAPRPAGQPMERPAPPAAVR